MTGGPPRTISTSNADPKTANALSTPPPNALNEQTTNDLNNQSTNVPSHSSLFLEVLQAALGTRRTLSRIPSAAEWDDIYEQARRHCLRAFFLQAFERDGGQWGDRHGLPLDLKLRWLGKGAKCADTNRRLDAQCLQLSAKLTQSGYWNCLLKGEGVARLYPHPEWREAGDIDIWVDGGRHRLVGMVRRVTGRRAPVTYHHTDFPVFPRTHVELHFTPTWMFNPWRNRALQHWFRAHRQSHPADDRFPMPVPTDEFNLLYLLLHIFRHVFDEGIGLRQLVDYFYALGRGWAACPPSSSLDAKMRPLLRRFGLLRFAGGLMWVMEQALGLPRELEIAEPDERVGAWLLEDILSGGNFGHFSPERRSADHVRRADRLWWRLRLSLRRVRLFPGEALWEMPWRVWHFLWRWRHGYL